MPSVYPRSLGGCQSLSPMEMIIFQACQVLGKFGRNLSSVNVLYRGPGTGARLLDFKIAEENGGKEVGAPTGYVGAFNEG